MIRCQQSNRRRLSKPRIALPTQRVMAAGFDPTGAYLLAVSHSGCGVFATTSWGRVARDSDLAYPENGRAIGIGQIDGELIK